MARTSASLRLVQQGICLGTYKRAMMVERNYPCWRRGSWPFLGEERCRQRYFEYVGRKTKKPWFKSFDLPRGHIHLITRPRTGHYCVGALFKRLHWNISPVCRCGSSFSSLTHYILECQLFVLDRVVGVFSGVVGERTRHGRKN